MSASTTTVAAFDVDGTLTTVDTFLPFVRTVAGPVRSLLTAAGAAPLAAGVAVGRVSRDRLKARVVAGVFRGAPAERIDEQGRAHAERIRQRWLRPDTVARLRWHQAQGHRTILVSASLRPYLDPLGDWLGVDAVLCTDLGVGADGRLDGAVLGGNCRGPAKAERLLAHLGARPDELWAYGDSEGDRELLALAHHAVLLRRGLTLTAAPAPGPDR